MAEATTAMARDFGHADAKRFYDRLGRWQDTQGWYESHAVADMVAAADLATARAVGEFGCGTGKLAAELLASVLPEDARYVGFDVSETMVELARAKLRPWRGRALVVRTGGPPSVPVREGALDRLIAIYVLDLLDQADSARFVAEARRTLVPGGRLGIVSLTCPDRGLARVVARLWSAVRAWRPGLVGGCRPIDVAPLLPAADWAVEHRRTITQMLVSSQIVVATRR